MKRKPLPTLEFCKKHNVDHTGTYCGHCVELWKKHSLILQRVRRAWKDVKDAPYREVQQRAISALGKKLK